LVWDTLNIGQMNGTKNRDQMMKYDQIIDWWIAATSTWFLSVWTVAKSESLSERWIRSRSHWVVTVSVGAPDPAVQCERYLCPARGCSLVVEPSVREWVGGIESGGSVNISLIRWSLRSRAVNLLLGLSRGNKIHKSPEMGISDSTRKSIFWGQ
jgi:hypothetical protein